MKHYLFRVKEVFFLLLVVLFVFCGKTQVVSAAPQYTVTFANAKGAVNSVYKKLEVTAEAGTVIELPDMPRDGYQAFWVRKDVTPNKKYQAGSNFQVKEDVVLCLAYSKLYNVRFFTANGSKEYTRLRMQLCEGQSFVFPEGNTTDTRKFLGWTKTTYGSSYKKAGEKGKVTGNMKFYLKAQAVYTVSLCKNDGTVYKKYRIPLSRTLNFPNASTGTADMFLGWSSAPGKTNNPEFEVGSKIPRKAAKYYMVVYPEILDKAPASLSEPLNHEKVYFVGDSRTVDMERALGEKASEKVTFICKGSQGLAWFKETAYRTLLTDVRKQPKRMKKAVVFNLGVNDMYNADAYITYMKAVAKTLKTYNCEVYFMSVNPLNSAVTRAFGLTSRRTEQQVADFNNKLYKGLCSNKIYTYINTWSQLKKNGWISNRWDQGIVDGLHYSPDTSLKIYNYCIRYLNR